MTKPKCSLVTHSYLCLLYSSEKPGTDVVLAAVQTHGLVAQLLILLWKAVEFPVVLHSSSNLILPNFVIRMISPPDGLIDSQYLHWEAHIWMSIQDLIRSWRRGETGTAPLPWDVHPVRTSTGSVLEESRGSTQELIISSWNKVSERLWRWLAQIQIDPHWKSDAHKSR